MVLFVYCAVNVEKVESFLQLIPNKCKLTVQNKYFAYKSQVRVRDRVRIWNCFCSVAVASLSSSGRAEPSFVKTLEKEETRYNE
jgi:hypothetical protein